LVAVARNAWWVAYVRPLNSRIIHEAKSPASDEKIASFRISRNLLLTLCRYIKPHKNKTLRDTSET